MLKKGNTLNLTIFTWQKKAKIMTMLLLFGCLMVRGQTLHTNKEIKQRGLSPKLTGFLYTINPKHTGSPFLFDEWHRGTIIRWDSLEVEYNQLNYHANKGMLAKNTPLNRKFLVHKNQIKGFTIHKNGKKRRFELIKLDNEKQFLEVLYDGTAKIYAARIFDIDYSLVNNNQYNKSVYYRNDAYYMKINGNWEELRPNKRQFYDFFDKEAVNRFINKYQLNIKDNEQDLVRMVKMLENNH